MSEQSRSESPEQAEAFECYVRMRRRSLRALAGQLSKARSTVEKWSTDGCWVERARRRDAAAATIAEEQWVKEVNKRRRQKRATGEELLRLALTTLAKKDHPLDLRPSDVISFVRTANDMLDQVVDETEPTDPREIEALVREFAEDEGLDVEQALSDTAGFERKAGPSP